jgi:hypothetical protein
MNEYVYFYLRYKDEMIDVCNKFQIKNSEVNHV